MKIYGTITEGKPWLDYSSLSMLMKCPRAYYWRCQQDLIPTSAAIYFTNGKAYHAAIDTYHRCRLDGDSHEQAIAPALMEAKSIMSEITVEDKKRNLTVAVDTLINYFERWKDEPYITHEVEIGFAVDLGDFMFVGKIDRIADMPFGRVIGETKTTTIVGTKWQSRGKPNLQIDGYVSAYYITTGIMPWGGMLDIIPIHEDSRKRQDPFRILSTRNISDVEAWTDNVQEWWKTLKRFREDQVFPQNTEQCNPLTGMSCEYNILCQTYNRPWLEPTLEISDEFKRERWLPFEELNIGGGN